MLKSGRFYRSISDLTSAKGLVDDCLIKQFCTCNYNSIIIVIDLRFKHDTPQPVSIGRLGLGESFQHILICLNLYIYIQRTVRWGVYLMHKYDRPKKASSSCLLGPFIAKIEYFLHVVKIG